MRKKLTFDDVCEAINDGRHVDVNEVRADALRRHVWIAEWHVPGCLSETQSLCLTRGEAISAALDMASDENGPPRGMRADLMRSGRSDRVSAGAWARQAITTIARHQLRDIL